MHKEAKDFTIFVKKHFPQYFIEKEVLDVGSGDINGNNRWLFKNCSYEGNDVIKAKNVTIVSRTKDLSFNDCKFDTIVSTECFEHDPEYKESFLKIYKMLKPDGLFFFTCASTGRKEHGTRKCGPKASYGTRGNIEDMMDYYKNLTIDDVDKIKKLNEIFFIYDSYYNSNSKDLYFLGIKKGKNDIKILPKYKDDGIKITTKK